VQVVCEGWSPLPLVEECPGQTVDWAAERAKHPWAFADGEHWPWHVHAFRIRTPAGDVLVDAGVGAFGPWAPWAQSPDPTAWAELDPARVRHVVVTHLHADHAGGTVGSDGLARFPNARYHVHPADWQHFDGSPVIRPSDGGRYDARDAMDVLATTGMISLEARDHEVSPGVQLVHTPGHTPGHRSVVVEAGNGALLLTGDLLHLPVQVANPGWPSSHDQDPATGSASRTACLGRAREGGWQVAVSHFARPFGLVSEDGWSSTP
jgi:glyoxylase-like metal-dependent hydrolase (beta-lactamase superfamily II)